MDVDLIILPKGGETKSLHLGIKHQIETVFTKLYEDVEDDKIHFDLLGEKVSISYKLSSKTANMLFVKFTSDYTPAKSAKVMDVVVNRLIQGEHRKLWNIVISYDEVSQLYCCKLMPLFGRFERRTRELVYLTIIKIFGVEWYEKSFSQNLQSTLLGKGKGNKTKLVEGALNELTYEQLKEYLFMPFCGQSLGETLEDELSKDNIEGLSKEELVKVLDKCRSESLWNRFFSEYKQFKDFRNRIEKLQPHRNSVMHHKRIIQTEYERIRKELKFVNKRLEEAILLLEDEMYTETKLTDVVSALGSMLSNILGSSMPKWVDQMKPALASFGRLAIESAMPKINIPDIMPSLNLGAEMAQKFHEIYQMPTAAIQAATQLAGIEDMVKSSMLAPSYLNQINSIVNSHGMVDVREMTEQANQMRTILNSSMLNNSAFMAVKQFAEENTRIVQSLTQPLLAFSDTLPEVKPKADEESLENKSGKNGEDDEKTIN